MDSYKIKKRGDSVMKKESIHNLMLYSDKMEGSPDSKRELVFNQNKKLPTGVTGQGVTIKKGYKLKDHVQVLSSRCFSENSET
jgi:hypothetical protein